jgi:hypothetical protein
MFTKITLPALAIIALAVFATTTAQAQSAGANFTADVDNTVCSINSATGSFNDMFTQGSGGELRTQIKLPNSSPGLLVTPSLVTGLYTNTLSTGSTTDSMQNRTAAIVVTVKDEQVGYPTVFLTPNQTCVNTTTGTHCGVVYDERFQALNTVLGDDESVQLILSTLAAHSFNFTRANVPGGIHTITLNWYFGCDDGSGTLSTAACRNPMAFAPNTAAACAGPGTLTVTQVQQFQHSSQIGTTVGTGP